MISACITILTKLIHPFSRYDKTTSTALHILLNTVSNITTTCSNDEEEKILVLEGLQFLTEENRN